MAPLEEWLEALRVETPAVRRAARQEATPAVWAGGQLVGRPEAQRVETPAAWAAESQVERPEELRADWVMAAWPMLAPNSTSTARW